jgi:hypothetical protein
MTDWRRRVERLELRFGRPVVIEVVRDCPTHPGRLARWDDPAEGQGHVCWPAAEVEREGLIRLRWSEALTDEA